MYKINPRQLRMRYFKEKCLRVLCVLSLLISLCFLITLIGSIAYKSIPALTTSYLTIDVSIPATLDASKDNGRNLLRNAIFQLFPDTKTRKKKKALYALLSFSNETQLNTIIRNNTEFIGRTIQFKALLSDNSTHFLRKLDNTNDVKKITTKLSTYQQSALSSLYEEGYISWHFNTVFFTNGDSREPENAGIIGAIIGSIYVLGITLLISLPVGVAAALYLEEFAARNRFTEIIEININNLAAVPSIVFGLLGLNLFINHFSLARSSSIVGGLILSLLTLPVIIIASRSAIKAIPVSIKHGALALGASPVQVALHHTFVLSLPGILTGSIIGMARALGESAPLLMIGMVAFIADIPRTITDSATVLPVQIFIWSDSPERSFEALSSLASLILVIFLIAMNAVAIYLRKKYEKKW